MTHLFKLRDYQQSAVDAALNHVKYRRGVHGFVTAPGGSGKSVMIAKLAEAIYNNKISEKIIILARNEKLLRQNMAKLTPEHQLMAGIYCAGLGSKDADKPIVVASVQSIAGVEVGGSAPIVIVDECHNITNDASDETQFWSFARSLNQPTIIGFTATPYRQKGGKLTWGDEIISIPLEPLFNAGHLVRPTNKAPVAPDLNNIQVKMGEYVESQLEAVFTDPELLRASVEAILRYLPTRNCCVVFTQTRKHSTLLLQSLRDSGLNDEAACCVDGTTDKHELSIILDNWGNPNHPLKMVINCQLLKEGIDVPEIDMVVSLRSTISKTLWEQILYRGTRPALGKVDFLVLDMGSNFMRLGGLGSPYTEKGSKEAAAPKGRICPSCETMVMPVTAKDCRDCGYIFPEPDPPKVNHDHAPDMNSDTYHKQQTAWHDVKSVTYSVHQSRNSGNTMIRVDYHCTYETHSEYLMPLHDSEWVRSKVDEHYKKAGNDLIAGFGWSMKNSMSEEEIYSIYIDESMKLRWPSQIKVEPDKKNPKYKRISGKLFDESGSGNTNQLDPSIEEDAIQF